MYPKSIQKLIDLFSQFPTVGPRTAARFVFYLIKLPQAELEELSSSLKELKENIKICSWCFNSFDSSSNSGQASSGQAGSGEICPICEDKTRDKSLLCIIEKETDLTTIEKTKKYKGLYFILGGTINLKKRDKKDIRIEQLKERVKDNGFKEVIIAINPTTEGEITRLLIERELKPFNVKITHLGRGLPMGGELEYADSDTLSNSFDSRK
ncbi:MAG: recombination mediator RecR [bacterium]|nr:recombination mediator RecR [bacterium]